MAIVYDINGNRIKEITLPKVFAFKKRFDLIQRAFLAHMSRTRQAYGVDPLAGFRTSAHYHGVGRGFNAMKNREMARAQRVHGSNPGQNLRARIAPQARSGREAHPPKTEKSYELKINRKEKHLALLSSIAATGDYSLVSSRHRIPKIDVPIIVSDSIESIASAKDIMNFIEKLKLSDDIERAKEKKIRAGKGKLRGRKYKQKKSLLIVAKNAKTLKRACGNIPGVDVCDVARLSVNMLAPGGQPGRLTIYTEGAIKELEKYG